MEKQEARHSKGLVSKFSCMLNKLKTQEEIGEPVKEVGEGSIRSIKSIRQSMIAKRESRREGLLS